MGVDKSEYLMFGMAINAKDYPDIEIYELDTTLDVILTNHYDKNPPVLIGKTLAASDEYSGFSGLLDVEEILKNLSKSEIKEEIERVLEITIDESQLKVFLFTRWS